MMPAVTIGYGIQLLPSPASDFRLPLSLPQAIEIVYIGVVNILLMTL
jgi:hypothetical protein